MHGIDEQKYRHIDRNVRQTKNERPIRPDGEIGIHETK